MIACVVEAVIRSKIKDTVVVTGSHHDQIATVLKFTERARLVRNPDPSRGMLSSVRCGLAAIDPSADGIAVLLGDQPGVRSEMIDAVINAWIKSAASIAVPKFGNRRGHPLVFDVEYREEILTKFDAIGLRGLLAAHADVVLEVPIDSTAVLEDIDTPEDYKRLNASHRR